MASGDVLLVAVWKKAVRQNGCVASFCASAARPPGVLARAASTVITAVMESGSRRMAGPTSSSAAANCPVRTKWSSSQKRASAERGSRSRAAIISRSARAVSPAAAASSPPSASGSDSRGSRSSAETYKARVPASISPLAAATRRRASAESVTPLAGQNWAAICGAASWKLLCVAARTAIQPSTRAPPSTASRAPAPGT